MDRSDVAENQEVETTVTEMSAYVPSFQLTKGQSPPIAANGGLSYMSFDRDGDGGTAAALAAARAQIESGEGQRVVDMLAAARPGSIAT